jgi:hypothetical protein
MKYLLILLVLVGCSQVQRKPVEESLPLVEEEKVIPVVAKAAKYEETRLLAPFRVKGGLHAVIQGTFLGGAIDERPSYVIVIQGKKYSPEGEEKIPEDQSFCRIENNGDQSQYIVGDISLNAILAGFEEYYSARVWTVQLEITPWVKIVCVGPKKFTLDLVKKELGEIVRFKE